ncbi:hypothetical protein [Verrucomicrobium sp. GAS474]|uniref:hypothetical protein n=1 Tax=Verrucomicrobium sp. GAS474 TaxID=1882831 RepID=UPI0012FFCA85|nr:hypothetical protein [Verrucomicrobium sp. GAS474]
MSYMTASVPASMAMAVIMPTVEVKGPIVGIISGLVIISVVANAHIGSCATGKQGEEECRSADQSQSFHGCSLVHITQSARGVKPASPPR